MLGLSTEVNKMSPILDGNAVVDTTTRTKMSTHKQKNKFILTYREEV